MIAKTWKQSQCLWVGEWIAQTMGYYLELIRNEISINEKTCKKFKDILLSKISQSDQSLLLLLLLLLSPFSRVRLCDPIDGSPPGSPVPGILQARTLEWVAISFSNAWKWKVKVKSLSRVWLLATSRTAAYEAPPSMGFSRQECWSGVPLPSPSLLLRLVKWN